MKKKLVLWTMAAMLAFSATACGGGSGDSGSAAPEKKEEASKEGSEK